MTADSGFLNLGHTFGHGIEACSGFAVSHGSAVAIGMAMIVRSAAQFGFCTTGTRDTVLDLLRQYGLPVDLRISGRTDAWNDSTRQKSLRRLDQSDRSNGCRKLRNTKDPGLRNFRLAEGRRCEMTRTMSPASVHGRGSDSGLQIAGAPDAHLRGAFP